MFARTRSGTFTELGKRRRPQGISWSSNSTTPLWARSANLHALTHFDGDCAGATEVAHCMEILCVYFSACERAIRAHAA